MALQDHDETQQIIPAPAPLEASEGCLARGSLTFIGSEQMETTFGRNRSPGFFFFVAGEEGALSPRRVKTGNTLHLHVFKESHRAVGIHAFYHILLSTDTMYT